MDRIAVFLTLCAASAVAESNLRAPLVGIGRDIQGRIRIISGIPGNFILRDAIASAALDWAFGGSGGLMKTDAELLKLDSSGKVIGRRAAPRGDAVLGPSAAFFPVTGELWQANVRPDYEIEIQQEAIGGRVAALGAASGRTVALAVCRESRLWLLTVDAASGALTHEVLAGGVIGERGCAGALLWLDGDFLLATAHDLVIQTSAGDERHVALAGGTRGNQPELHRAGEHWVQVDVAGSPPLLVHVTTGEEKLYRLPAMGAYQ